MPDHPTADPGLEVGGTTHRPPDQPELPEGVVQKKASRCRHCGGQEFVDYTMVPISDLPTIEAAAVERERERLREELKRRVGEHAAKAAQHELAQEWFDQKREVGAVGALSLFEGFLAALTSEVDDPCALEEAEREAREESLGEMQVERRIEREVADGGWRPTCLDPYHHRLRAAELREGGEGG